MNAKVLLAVFKRNFVGYFTSPTGYVFICVFVLLGSVAAFLTDEFFDQNLANLDQLNKWFPFIMLVFVPAIAMSIWAEERRQGTDELLLTIPAGDFDIVLGKYLAALGIFSVSLVFSLFCNLMVLEILGNPDKGLLFSTYVGYWLVGLAMLAVAMVASFLTSNLTIAYLLGALFNVPLVAGVWAGSLVGGTGVSSLFGWLFGRDLGQILKQWSIQWQFADFGRGVLSLSHVMYFAAICAVMLYLSVAFIGRRHWRTGVSALPNYALYGVQMAALLVIGANLCSLAEKADSFLRWDVTSEQLSSLSPETRKLLDDLDPDQPIQIEAFISREQDVPESYLQTRTNLLNALREMDALGGRNVRLALHDRMEPYTDEATRAQQRYGIVPQSPSSFRPGGSNEPPIFMGVALTCGLRKVTAPFIDRGIPVEYELIRSIATVSRQKRKKIGVLTTDAQVFGQFNPMMMMGPGSQDWLIVKELRQQYEVVQVRADGPIDDSLDALLAVQPSSLGPEQMTHFLEAIRSGMPTVIFEDPCPVAGQAPATTAPRRAPGGMNRMMGMMGGQQAPPKGDIQELWGILGVDFSPGPAAERWGDPDLSVVWQDYNPIPKLRGIPKQFIFIDQGVGIEEPFGLDSGISRDLQHLVLLFPGWIRPLESSNLEFTPLVRTGKKGGTVPFQEIQSNRGDDLNRVVRDQSFIMAAHITGEISAAPPAVMGDTDPLPASEINVVLVADIDMIADNFFQLRTVGAVPESEINFDFDNVTFVLNALDLLAGDERFLAIRSRRPTHRILTRVEEKVAKARQEAAEAEEQAQDEYDQQLEKLAEDREELIENLKRELRETETPQDEILRSAAAQEKTLRNREDKRTRALADELRKEKYDIETKKRDEIRRVQNTYKFLAVALPPIPPLFVAIGVWFVRRTREREGVARTRLRA